MSENPETRGNARSAREVFLAFLALGCRSFGGPIAHLGYFRDELVLRREWIDERGYAELVALCQFLPGPTSSQVGAALGFLRGGPLGALAAWLAFTLPSAVLLVLFAYAATALDGPVAHGVLSGLKVAAVAIVAQAVWGMAKSLCPDVPRAAIAIGAGLIAMLVAGTFGQVIAIAVGAVVGLAICRQGEAEVGQEFQMPASRTAGVACLVAFVALLIGLPILAAATGWQAVAVFDAFYRAGALVFGGGHVVLPLLATEVVGSGWVGNDQFLAGYGAAQAVPGPLFTFAAYLGALLQAQPNGIAGAGLALVAIFLPGFLVLFGVLPFWNSFRRLRSARPLINGANAAVVGILGAALYDPVFTSAVSGPWQLVLALLCFLLLVVCRASAWIVVLVAVAGGVLISFG